MKRKVTFLLVIGLIASNYLTAQISFGDVYVQGQIGSGAHEAMFVLDYDSDPVGEDSTFAWLIKFDTDSVCGDSILSWISQTDANFTYDMGGGFLNNINYTFNSILYTNPNTGWFSMLESTDGTNWNWNNGISDKVADQEWFGIVAMNTTTYEAEINVPVTVGINDIENNSVSIYPNPAIDYIYVKYSQNASIEVMNMNGKILLENLQTDERIDLSSLESGAYIIKIIQNNITSYNKLIIK
jgi:hypothetical protein